MVTKATDHVLDLDPVNSLNMNGNRIEGVGSPVLGTDAANKDFVDSTVGTEINNALAGLETVPPGAIIPYIGTTAPSGFLLCDGSAANATANEGLFNVIAPSLSIFGPGTSTGGPSFDSTTDVWTLSAHGFVNDDSVHLTNSGGALPAGFFANTHYFVITVTTNTFQLSLAKGGAAVNGTNNGTGLQLIFNSFNTPDLRGRFPLGLDNMGGTPANRVTNAQADILGGNTGQEDFTQTISTMAAHSHQAGNPTSPGSGNTGRLTAQFGFPTSVDGGSSAINIMNPYLTVNYIIKV